MGMSHHEGRIQTPVHRSCIALAVRRWEISGRFSGVYEKVVWEPAFLGSGILAVSTFRLRLSSGESREDCVGFVTVRLASVPRYCPPPDAGPPRRPWLPTSINESYNSGGGSEYANTDQSTPSGANSSVA